MPAPAPELTAPQLRAPISNAYLGSVHVPSSLAPSFRWEPSPDAAPASSYELQISADPKFERALLSIKTAETQVAPANALPTSRVAPVGARYYWRVRACDATGCSAFSSTRTLNLGRSDHDFNGDGFADLLVGAPTKALGEYSKVLVYEGGPNAFDVVPDGTLIASTFVEEFGASLAAVGDINGDGFADIAVGAPGNNANMGAVYIYFGGAGASLDATPDVTLSGLAAQGRFGSVVSGAGDIDNDGFADLVVGARAYGGVAAAYMYFGPTVSDTRHKLDIRGSASFGLIAGAAGDLDGDGYGDVVVGSAGDSVRVVWGAARDKAEATTALSSSAAAFAGGSDVNGDGFADVLIAGGSEHTALYFGGIDRDMIDERVARYAEADPGFGSSVALPGDVDGDGYGEVVIGATAYATGSIGGAYLYAGGPSVEFNTIAYSKIVGGDAVMREWLLASPGDVNGDGFADVVVSVDEWSSKSVSIYAGGDRAALEAPAYAVLHGSTGGFGDVVGVRAPDAAGQ